MYNLNYITLPSAGAFFSLPFYFLQIYFFLYSFLDESQKNFTFEKTIPFFSSRLFTKCFMRMDLFPGTFNIKTDDVAVTPVINRLMAS